MRKLIVFLILLGILLAVLDRVAVSGVQREIAKQVAARYDLNTQPEVTIEGIPFLTQAVSGRYEEIRLELGPISQKGVRLSDVTATLYGVTAPLADLVQNAADAQIMAERVVGTIVVPWTTIAQRAPRGVKVAGAGDTIRVSTEITVRGVRVPVAADMKVEIVDGGVRLVPERVTVAGGIPVPADTSRLMTYTIPIQNLPLDIKVTGVRNVAAGLEVTGEAADVPLRG